MRSVIFFRLVLVLAVSFSFPASAMPSNLSKPEYIAPTDTIPAAQDIPYPGTMTLVVDASDNRRGVLRVTQTITAVKAGKLTLLYPEWLPGNHAPRGEIEKVAGLQILGNGSVIPWTRDDVDVYAFHIDVPEGVSELTIKFDFVSATAENQGRIVMAPSMLNLRWQQVSFYPAGYYVRNIPVQPTAIYPVGWRAATALRTISSNGNSVTYEKTDYDTLVDSPVFAGRYFQTYDLTDKVSLNIVADDNKFLKPKKDQIDKHIKLVREAEKLFGSQPYDNYEFLLALTEEMGSIGLEHHRSSENGVNREYFTEWNNGPGRRNLLPHEMTHSWNGKHKRPEDMWTPDFRQPMRGSLLWVYEGQTQFWGYVLGARSGLFSKQDTLDAYAAIAADLDLRKGREWRPLIDTTLDPVIAARRPKPWTSWQRSEDYYNEGLLIWLEADQIIRRESNGRKSLDDFANLFFGGKNGDWGVVTYNKQDVIDTLNKVQPYDWMNFVDQRVYKTTDEAPKTGLELGGYRLVYTDVQSNFLRDSDRTRKQTDLSHSLGLAVSDKGIINSVIWGGPAFKAGLKSGLTISAINGKAYSADALKQSVEEGFGNDKPIEIFAKDGDKYTNFMVDYSGGLRYPALEKINNGEGAHNEAGIDRLLKPKTK